MKLTLKKLLLVTIILITLVVVSYFAIFWYVSTAWKIHHRGKIELVKQEIKEEINYPKNFSELIDTLRPSTRSMKTMYHEKVFCTLNGMNRYPRPRTDNAGYRYYSEEVLEIIERRDDYHSPWTNLFDEKMLFAFGLEKKLTAKEIESYFFMNKVISVKQENGQYIENTGIKEVSKTKFNKSIEDLKTPELIEIFVLFGLGSKKYYQNNKDKYQARLEMFESILESYRMGKKKVLN